MKYDLQQLLQFIYTKLNIVLSYVKNAYIKNYSSKQFVYEIKECHKNNDDKQIIVAKIINSPKSFLQCRPWISNQTQRYLIGL